MDNPNPFTHFYAQLSHQGNMLQDYVRTGTYQQAILKNPSDFQGKVVLDVGTGSGILAFFAIQAGAARVYAVDASDSCIIAQKLADHNNFATKIVIIKGKIEDIELPEKVDVIISEPIGFLLVHERMLESYVIARDRFLKPGGKMYPTTGSIVLAPITDESLYQEQLVKIQFWNTRNFYGIDLTPAVDQAYIENFSQAVVGYFHPNTIVSGQRSVHTIDFRTVTCDEIKEFTIDFSFRIDRTSIVHGLGGWFDITFLGSNVDVILPTGPDSPGTHWYQCRLLFREPLALNKGQYLNGKLHFLGNTKFSYDITMNGNIQGTDVLSENSIHLQDQMYHYLTAAASATDAMGNRHGDGHGL